ncbi:MAG: ribonuclease P [Candidatus Aenigmarchaeota archaeon]|nr:ribonuclease P [Candidatus Aenigmarchaeota archaeon]
MGKKDDEKAIAKERIAILFELGKKCAKKEPKLAARYVLLAKKIGMRYNVSLGRESKKLFCRNCFAYFVPGANCRVRTLSDKQSVSIKCLSCNFQAYFPYIKEKMKRKEN